MSFYRAINLLFLSLDLARRLEQRGYTVEKLNEELGRTAAGTGTARTTDPQQPQRD